ncbi:hypothetical protein QYE76_016622, partial [Lolium multiflorum]
MGILAVTTGEASPGTHAARLLCLSGSSTSVETGVLAVEQKVDTNVVYPAEDVHGVAGHHGEVFLGPMLDANLDPFDDFGPNVQFQEDVEGDDEEEYSDDMDNNKVRRDRKSRYVLKRLKGGSPPPPAVSEDIKNVYETRVTRYSEVQCAILCSLEAELQKRFEHHDPCDMMRELKLIFETHAAVESYEASKQFFNCMMEEGSSVSEHMFAMSGHAKKLSDLGIVIPNKLGIHRVLQSLPPSYKNFVMNYNMQNMNKELPELFSMLKSAEVEIKKENQVLMVNKTTSFKKQGKPNKGNFKKGGKKVAAPPEKPKAGPKPETVCYYCQGKGHWKRNCSKYLADLKSGHAKKK